MSKAYYLAEFTKFQKDSEDLILGELTRHHQFSLEDLQKAEESKPIIKFYPDRVYHPIKSNKNNFVSHIELLVNQIKETEDLDSDAWIKSAYKPTPTCSGLIPMDTSI